MNGVVGGRLRLKKPRAGPVAGKVQGGKSAQPRQSKPRTAQERLEQGAPRDASASTAVETLLADAVPRRDVEFTDAELSFMLNQAKREKQRVAKAAEKTYREKIEEMNQKLAKLTEINDIPKIGPG